AVAQAADRGGGRRRAGRSRGSVLRAVPALAPLRARRRRHPPLRSGRTLALLLRSVPDEPGLRPRSRRRLRRRTALVRVRRAGAAQRVPASARGRRRGRRRGVLRGDLPVVPPPLAYGRLARPYLPARYA